MELPASVSVALYLPGVSILERLKNKQEISAAFDPDIPDWIKDLYPAQQNPGGR